MALLVSAFDSASAETVPISTSIIGTRIDDMILAESFKTDVQTLQKLKAGLVPAPKWSMPAYKHGITKGLDTMLLLFMRVVLYPIHFAIWNIVTK